MSREGSIRDYYRRIEKELRETIRNKDDRYMLGVDVDEYTEYLLSRFAFQEIVFDESKGYEIDKKRDERSVRGLVSGEHHTLEKTYAEIYVPILPNPRVDELLGLMASSFTTSPLKIVHSNGSMVVRSEPDEESIQKQIKELKREIEWKNEDIRYGNERIREFIRQEIEDRKAKIESEEDLFNRLIEKLPIPISRKPKPDIVIPDFSVKKEMKPILEPVARKNHQLILEKEKVDLILQLIDNTCLQFERTPGTFSRMDELDLRNVILSNLNGVFKGRATGEAFSKRGRTDIHLKIDEGGIFIAECKFWKGEKAMYKAIDQVLSYLTWRESYGVLIFFSRKKNFTSVVEQAYEEIEKHSSYRRGKKKLSDSHLTSQNSLPSDQQKIVEIHYLTYNLCPD
jgi:hypothetical protein